MMRDFPVLRGGRSLHAQVTAMRIAYLECFSGISGDMFLGALIDAGVSPALLEQTVASLNVGARLEIKKVQRSGIAATKVDVWVGNEKELPVEEFREKEHHRHSEHHHHAQPGASRPQELAHGRHLGEIRGIIERAQISAAPKQTAIRIFEQLAAAEAAVHGASPEHVHLHEVGAVDAIVDITCAAVGAEALGVDEWVCSPLNVGGGSVQAAHGTLPVPPPAVLELLRDAPVYSAGPRKELVTPTGAAIVRALVTRFSEFPAMKIERTGHGAGTRDFPNHANVLRLTIGESTQAVAAAAETITVLEANVDDLNPQVAAYVLDRALAEGALDAFATAVQMKKGRPGVQLTLLARPADADRLTRVLFAETTTLGVRRRDERRHALAREFVTVRTAWGDVRMKVASLNGAISNYSPEYEDCRRIAAEHRLPLKQVMQEAIRVYLEGQHG